MRNLPEPRILKCPVEIREWQRLPLWGQILDIQHQGDVLVAWVLGLAADDAPAHSDPVELYCYPTGYTMPHEEAEYLVHIKTVQPGLTVWHFFQAKRKQAVLLGLR